MRSPKEKYHGQDRSSEEKEIEKVENLIERAKRKSKDFQEEWNCWTWKEDIRRNIRTTEMTGHGKTHHGKWAPVRTIRNDYGRNVWPQKSDQILISRLFNFFFFQIEVWSLLFFPSSLELLLFVLAPCTKLPRCPFIYKSRSQTHCNEEWCKIPSV